MQLFKTLIRVRFKVIQAFFADLSDKGMLSDECKDCSDEAKSAFDGRPSYKSNPKAFSQPSSGGNVILSVDCTWPGTSGEVQDVRFFHAIVALRLFVALSSCGHVAYVWCPPSCVTHLLRQAAAVCLPGL